MWRIFGDNDGHNHWQTYRLVVGAEIQTNCHFEAHKYYFSCQLGLTAFAALCYILDYRITLWCGYICNSSCLLISVVSFTKIFRTLIYHQEQVQVPVQLQSSQPNSLNIFAIRLALVVCYVPHSIVAIVFAKANKKNIFITFTPHQRNSSNLNLLQLDVKPVSLLLEDLWSETSSEADNQTKTLLSMELDLPRLRHYFRARLTLWFMVSQDISHFLRL